MANVPYPPTGKKPGPPKGVPRAKVLKDPNWVSPLKGKKKPNHSITGKSFRPADRLRDVEDMMLSVEPRTRITGTLALKYNVSEETIRGDMRLIKEKLAEQMNTENPFYTIAQCRAMLEESFRMARTEKDPRSMVLASKTIADITGIAGPKRVDITSGGKSIATLTDAELEQRISDLVAIVTKAT